MTQSYAIPFLRYKERIEGFQFYFKQVNFRKNMLDDHAQLLQSLVQPRLKIAVVTETWPLELNSGSSTLAGLCKALQELGHKVLLIRPTQTGHSSSFQPYREYLIQSDCIFKYQQPLLTASHDYQLVTVIEEYAPQVIHVATDGVLGLTTLQIAKSKKIPILSGYYSLYQGSSRLFDLAFLMKPVQKYLRWFYNNTSLICVSNDETVNELRQFGVTTSLKTIGYGVDFRTFHPQRRSEVLRQQWNVSLDTTVLLYAGALSTENEISVLIRSYQSMLKLGKKVQLVIVGDGPNREKLMSMDHQQQIIFTGALTGSCLLQAYASADVFICPRQNEKMDRTVFEAMASGLPVLAYADICTKRYITHGITGWLIPLGGVDQLILQLYQLPNNDILKKMGQQLRANALKVSWQQSVRQFENVLYSMI